MTAVIEAAVAAARAGDLAALDALVDWPLSGLPALAAALERVDAVDRAALAERGLAELSSADPATRAGPLRRLRAALGRASAVRPAGPDARREMMAALRVPPEWALAARAARVRDVFEADGFTFAVTPEGDRLIVRT